MEIRKLSRHVLRFQITAYSRLRKKKIMKWHLNRYMHDIKEITCPRKDLSCSLLTT